jgi:hypothetical protein
MAVTLPAAAMSQEQQAPPPPPDTTELVFNREVFNYPEFARRNPFTPLISGDLAGPRFEELQLLGIVYSANQTLSVALFGSGNRGGPNPGGGPGAQSDTHRAHVGDRVGNMRVIEIQRAAVIVEVEEFGLMERHVMELLRPGRGGSL